MPAYYQSLTLHAALFVDKAAITVITAILVSSSFDAFAMLARRDADLLLREQWELKRLHWISNYLCDKLA